MITSLLPFPDKDSCLHEFALLNEKISCYSCDLTQIEKYLTSSTICEDSQNKIIITIHNILEENRKKLEVFQTRSTIPKNPNVEITRVTDVFLSHAWAADEMGRSNHDRVSIVNTLLSKAGFKTWFDEKDLDANLRHEISLGLTYTKCAIVFLTRQYETKVNIGDSRDYCYYEFDYITRHFPNGCIIPVIMEESMKERKSWSERVRAELHGLLSISMVEDGEIAANMNELVLRVTKAISINSFV